MKISTKRFKYILFLPLLIYLGERSYIAQDEGYYALQARWILEKGNWLAPMWWQQVIYDRTIGIQWLIAVSQKFLGSNLHASHLPGLISALICLYFTHKLTNETIGNKLAILSPLILATTYLWINNAHLAAQDMPLLAMEILGIYSIIKAKDNSDHTHLLLSGIWVGPAFMFKSFMVLLPIFSLLPYIITYRKNIISSRVFWYGLILGSTPAIIWISLSVHEYGMSIIFEQINKLDYLSQSDQYRKSFIYYIWNVPINTLPWFIFSIIGVINLFKSKKYENIFILTYYPLILIGLLSFFNTKTPYYALQITPFIAITANIGLQKLFSDKANSFKLIKYLISFCGLIIICSSIVIIIVNTMSGFIFLQNKTGLYISIALTLGIIWFGCIFTSERNKLLSLIILGPYLAYCLTIQSGVLTDRSPEVREIFESVNLNGLLQQNKTNFLIPSNLNNEEYSNLIKIAIYTPILGERIVEITPTDSKELTWVHNKYLEKSKEDLNIVFKNKVINPWVLVKIE